MSRATTHIIFDLDGTIIDSKPEIQKAYRTVFNEIAPSVAPDLEQLDYSLNIDNLLKSVYGADSASIAEAKPRFINIYDNSDFNETLLYEGVFDTLSTLKAKGYELYIATNKRYIPTMRILQLKKINNLFSLVMANEMEPGVPFNKRQMISAIKHKGLFTNGYMVGDSIYDIIAAREENLINIAVSYGYDPVEKLAEKNPDYLINEFAGLLAIL